MSERPTRRHAVVYGAVLCSCLVVLLVASPTAAVVPPDGNPGGAAATEPDGADLAGGEAVRATAGSDDTTNCDGGSARADGVPDGTHTAVLDRIEADLAVLEVSDDAGDTHELVVETEDLPAAGRHPNAVFEIRVADGELRTATYDESRSEARLEDAQDRFDGLAKQPEEDDGEDDDEEEEEE